MDQDKVIPDNTQKKTYILLDWGGNIEDRCEMTEAQAKKVNEDLWTKEPRLIRWAPIKY